MRKRREREAFGVAGGIGCFMGAGPCCGFCYMCVTDDGAKDSIIPEPEPLVAQDRKRQWCVDDSATERVFIPDASRNKYVVVGLGGATIRMTARLESPVLKVLPQGTIVVVSQVRSRRAHIVKPMDGWASLQTESGYVILEAIMRPTKYKVVYREGIFVRSKANIEEGRIVRIAPFGSILHATGKTEIYDAVERIQVEDGWVSMRLREDKGSGAPLLMALN